MGSAAQGATSEEPMKLVALHRYWINANLLKIYFERSLADCGNEGLSKVTESPTARAFPLTDLWILMGYWYASLYIVVEGYWVLSLSDPAIDALLEENHIERLRRFRNGMFHYQRQEIVFLAIAGAVLLVIQIGIMAIVTCHKACEVSRNGLTTISKWPLLPPLRKGCKWEDIKKFRAIDEDDEPLYPEIYLDLKSGKWIEFNQYLLGTACEEAR